MLKIVEHEFPTSLNELKFWKYGLSLMLSSLKADNVEARENE